MRKQGQPWIQSPILDAALILSPPFLSVCGVLFFRNIFDQTTEVPLWAWVAFILCVDVAHVYSTIFRTYLNPSEFNENRTLLVAIPLFSWLVGVLLYSVNGMLFWSIIAYVAVFHFIRQQYGFMMLYSRNESEEQRKFKWIDRGLIYLTTLYPIIYWHTHMPRNFHWFIDGDFVSIVPKLAEPISLWLYVFFATLYVGKEAFVFWRTRYISLPKQVVVIGTALSWYVGIVMLNGDMAFTIINVVSHGLPYIGLIWIYGRKQALKVPNQPVLSRIKLKQLFSFTFLPVFIGVLLILAYLEEGLWDGFVWRDHVSLFSWFSTLPRITDHSTLAWLVPLLSLPQITHYVLDGFIWRLRDNKSSWQKVIFQTEVRAS